MPRYECPICGDPSAYPLWVTKEPPEACPGDDSWHRGGPVTIKNVTECSYQMRKARQRAEWMKVCPEAFDESGNLIRPYGLAMVLEKLPPDTVLII